MLRVAFVLLALWGAITPMSLFIAFFRENGIHPLTLIDAWGANQATSALMWDLTISAIALTVWVVAECWRRREWLGLVAIPATFCIGVSCGLPLYLALRPGTDT